MRELSGSDFLLKIIDHPHVSAYDEGRLVAALVRIFEGYHGATVMVAFMLGWKRQYADIFNSLL